MKQKFYKATTPTVGGKVQQSEAGVVEPQNESNTTDQVKNDQATVGAGLTDENEFCPWDGGVRPYKTEEKVSPTNQNMNKRGNTTKRASEKDYTPVYTDTKKKELQTITDICNKEIAEATTRYNGIPFGNNSIINLTEVIKKGTGVVCPKVNRTHGKDQSTTGESLMSDSPQHIILIITVKMSSAAGIECERFPNDPNNGKPISDDDIVIIDGNGRIDYLLSLPTEKWPTVWAAFISPDAAGYYNIPRAFDVINTKVAIWKTQDLVAKRILMDGDNVHEGWTLVNDLINKHGWKYQAATQFLTLMSDRLKKDAVSNRKASEIFMYFDCAKEILAAFRNKFGTDTDKVLGTKAVPMVVSSLWGKLRDKSGVDKATELFVNFVSTLDIAIVSSIIVAKSKRGGVNRDEQRRVLIENAFNAYFMSKKV